MSWCIELSPLAKHDLRALHRWVEDLADEEVADAYLERVAARIDTLAHFPRRGTPRSDLGFGVRSLPFERRLLIAYQINEATVTILRVISGARDIKQAFA